MKRLVLAALLALTLFAQDPGAPSSSTITDEMAKSNLLKSVAAVYPASAKAAGIEGTVKLGVTIGKEGKVMSIKVLGGPPLLRQAALDAVRRYEYRPFQLNGQPAEVQTEVEVVFKLP